MKRPHGVCACVCCPRYLHYSPSRSFSSVPTLEVAEKASASNAHISFGLLGRPSYNNLRTQALPVLPHYVIKHIPVRQREPRRPKLPRGAWKGLAVLCILALLSFGQSLPRSNNVRVIPVPSAGRNPAYLVRAANGAVATENGDCSTVGVDILKAGGNAVDSAVAVSFCIGVLNMFACVLELSFLLFRPPQHPTVLVQVWEAAAS
jgi:hypothetical protein